MSSVHDFLLDSDTQQDSFREERRAPMSGTARDKQISAARIDSSSNRKLLNFLLKII